MSAKRFSITFLAGVIVCFFGLFLLVDRILIPINPIPSYKYFLLKNAPGNKVIIFSGSNSHFSIIPNILEDYFGRTVINAADTGGWPLLDKIQLLKIHTIPGDIVILPLEWRDYYSEEIFPQTYIESILSGRVSFYYREMSLLRKLYFVICGIPWTSYRDAILKDKVEQSFKDILKNYQNFLSKLHGSRGEKFGIGKSKTGWIVENGSTITCDQYLFESRKGGIDMLARGEFSEYFKKNVAYLKMLKDSGVNIVFTWPSVAGKDCYQTEKTLQLDAAVMQLTSYLEGLGFQVIGKPQDSNFTWKYLHDTYYHITKEGAEIRTNRLLKRIKEAGISPFEEKISREKVNYILSTKLNDLFHDKKFILSKHTEYVN